MNKGEKLIEFKDFESEIDLMEDCFSLAKVVIGEKFELGELTELQELQATTPIAVCFYKEIKKREN